MGEWPPTSLQVLYPDVRLREIPKNQRRWREQGTLGWAFDPEDPQADAERVIRRFARRAFRRPIEPEVSDPYVQLALDAMQSGSDFETATRMAFVAILTSPQFLFLTETPVSLISMRWHQGCRIFCGVQCRMKSFCNWPIESNSYRRTFSGSRRTTPEPSQGGRIHDKNFTGQWLDLRNIKATSPDKQLYPEFDEMLELSMVGESEAYFHHLLSQDLPLTNLVDSEFLMLNRAMADHYGIAGTFDESFVRTPIPADSPRGGILTQAAVLKVTANGTVTSPVLRGTWVMKRLIGRPPQPPPPNVGSVEPYTRGATTIRELLDKHRRSPTCASCHNKIDPPGFALESFDVIGGWRDRYRSLGFGRQPAWKLEGRDIWEYKLGPSVDASGVKSSGERFKNINDFKHCF